MAIFIPIEEVVEDACHSIGDYLMRKKMRFLRFAKRIYNDDLNLGVIKDVRREFMYINRRTNTIDMPSESIKLSAISYMDECGVEWPLYRNPTLNDDIVDIKADKNCACSCGNELCNMIKGYESKIETITDSMPNGDPVTFKAYSIKGYDDNGSFYETKQYALRKYTNGVWTDTVLETEKTELCKLELDQNGCVVDCEENFQKVASCGCGTTAPGSSDLPGNVYRVSCTPILSTFSIACGQWYSCTNEFVNIYNISELGDRIIFPADFPIDKVLVRYFVNTNLKEMKIPSVARQAFITGLMYYHYENSADMNEARLSELYSRRYTDQKFALLQEMNKYTSVAKRMILTPPAKWTS